MKNLRLKWPLKQLCFVLYVYLIKTLINLDNQRQNIIIYALKYALLWTGSEVSNSPRMVMSNQCHQVKYQGSPTFEGWIHGTLPRGRQHKSWLDKLNDWNLSIFPLFFLNCELWNNVLSMCFSPNINSLFLLLIN